MGTSTTVMPSNPLANLTPTYVTIAHGVADRDFDGGGIENDGTLTVPNGPFRLNCAGFGGPSADFGLLTVHASTFQHNFARMGGVFFAAQALVITHSTITGSSADGTGGSILNAGGDVTVSNSMLVPIAAVCFGGAIGNLQGSVEPKGTLLAESPRDNCAAQGEDVITDEGYNLSDDGS